MLAQASTTTTRVFSTYDWTPIGGEIKDAQDFWADVKMPGGFPELSGVAFPVLPPFPPVTESRLTYAVGTTEVNTTGPGLVTFSQVAADPGAGVSPPSFILPLGFGVKRQVAILQFNDRTDQNTIQRYFYGSSVGTANQTRATNARAISVWRGATEDDDRIAICGETYDERLSLSQSPTGWTGATASDPSGFIAVYDGNGDLLWTHHFFVAGSEGDDCAITDVSVRVDAQGNDIVTYCGISTHGNPGIGSELSPLLPFPALVGGCSDGATHQGNQQWDGIVGRVVRAPGSPSVRQFHSIVSGPEQDGLFGIAEIDADRFVVVGSTETGTGPSDFPFSFGCGIQGPSLVGTAMLFDASQVGTPSGTLQLVWSTMLGTHGLFEPAARTVARDVHVVRGVSYPIGTGENATWSGATEMIYVVGSTTDPAFQWNFVPQPFAKAPPAGQDTLQGPSDGFVAVLLADGSGYTYSYHGGPGEDGLTGVSGYSAFPESIAVTGFTDRSGTMDIQVASYFFNNAFGPGNPGGNTAVANGTGQLLRIREDVIGGSAEDRPAAMGPVSATASSNVPHYETFGLNVNTFDAQEAGGGVAVGDDGRNNVVGSTRSQDYPVWGTAATIAPRGASPSLPDAVRTETDMVPPTQPPPLPAAIGISRTDGTGEQPVGSSFPPLTTSGFSGGTTPFCALSEFGYQIGLPAPSLQRMLIDFEGNALAGATTNDTLIVSRPPTLSGSFAFGVLQFGAPPTSPWISLTGADLWLGDPSAANVVITTPIDVGRAYRLHLSPYPAGFGLTISAQMVCALSAPIGAGACSSTVVASPAIWLTY